MIKLIAIAVAAMVILLFASPVVPVLSYTKTQGNSPCDEFYGDI